MLLLLLLLLLLLGMSDLKKSYEMLAADVVVFLGDKLANKLVAMLIFPFESKLFEMTSSGIGIVIAPWCTWGLLVWELKLLLLVERLEEMWREEGEKKSTFDWFRPNCE